MQRLDNAVREALGCQQHANPCVPGPEPQSETESARPHCVRNPATISGCRQTAGGWLYNRLNRTVVSGLGRYYIDGIGQIRHISVNGPRSPLSRFTWISPAETPYLWPGTFLTIRALGQYQSITFIWCTKISVMGRGSFLASMTIARIYSDTVTLFSAAAPQSQSNDILSSFA